MITEAYPTLVLYFLLAVGLPLAALRPKWGYLFGIVFALGTNSQMLTMTRFPALGPYFNASDACGLVAIGAVVSNSMRRRSRISFPKMVIALVTILLVGFAVGVQRLGYHYEILRSLRWALTLPLFFWASANLVRDEVGLKHFLLTLWIIGASAAAQQVLFARVQMEKFSGQGLGIGVLRTISYSLVGVLLLMAALIWFPKTSRPTRLALLALAPVIVLGGVLNQSRSVYIATTGALLVGLWWFRGHAALLRATGIVIVAAGSFWGASLLASRFTPGVAPASIIDQRMDELAHPPQDADDVTTRWRDIDYEFAAWSSGNPIVGEGLCYYMNQLAAEGTQFVSWGHIGPVTTLAQLGLLGFSLYYLILPWAMVRRTSWLWHSPDQWQRYLAVFAGYSLVWFVGSTFMSGNMLDQNPLFGIIVGALWGQSTRLDVRHRRSRRISPSKAPVPRPAAGPSPLVAWPRGDRGSHPVARAKALGRRVSTGAMRPACLTSLLGAIHK